MKPNLVTSNTSFLPPPPPVSLSLPAFKKTYSEFYLASSTFKCAITEVMNYRKIKKYTNENNNTTITNYD